MNYSNLNSSVKRNWNNIDSNITEYKIDEVHWMDYMQQ